MKRSRESYVQERDDNIKLTNDYHKAASQHRQIIHKILSQLNQLHKEHNYLRNRAIQIRNNQIRNLDRDYALALNRDQQYKITRIQDELERALASSHDDEQWNLEQADSTLNELYGYVGAPTFIGQGMLDDDEPKYDQVIGPNGQLMDSMDVYNRYQGYQHPIGPLTKDQYQEQFYANTDNRVPRNLNTANQVPYTVDWI